MVRKTWLSDIIGTEKAAFGLVHFLALPGDPLYDPEGGLEKIFEAALKDVKLSRRAALMPCIFPMSSAFRIKRTRLRRLCPPWPISSAA